MSATTVDVKEELLSKLEEWKKQPQSLEQYSTHSRDLTIEALTIAINTHGKVYESVGDEVWKVNARCLCGLSSYPCEPLKNIARAINRN